MVMAISASGLLGADSLPPDQQEQFGKILDSCRDDSEQAIATYEEKSAAADLDKSLSVLGKAERRRLLGKEALQAILKIGTRRQSLEHDLEKAKKELPADLPDRKKMNENQADAREIREFFMKMPILERRAALMAAADLDDVATLNAIRMAPPIFEIVPPEAIEKAIKRWIAVNHSEAFERVEIVQNVLSIFDSNLKSAERIVSQRSGFVPPAE